MYFLQFLRAFCQSKIKKIAQVLTVLNCSLGWNYMEVEVFPQRFKDAQLLAAENPLKL